MHLLLAIGDLLLLPLLLLLAYPAPGIDVKCKLSIRHVDNSREGSVCQVLDSQLTNGKTSCEVAWEQCLKAFSK